jgi:hypothetical protein
MDKGPPYAVADTASGKGVQVVPHLDIGPLLANIKKLDLNDTYEDYCAWADEMQIIFRLGRVLTDFTLCSPKVSDMIFLATA